jgi:hypothetical protein
MFRRKFLMAVIVAGIAALAGPARSEAGFSLTLPDTAVVNDVGGVIAFSGDITVNGRVYNVLLNSNVNDLSSPTSEGILTTQIAVKRVGGIGLNEDLVFSIVWNDPVGPNPAPLTFSAGGATNFGSQGSLHLVSTASPDLVTLTTDFTGSQDIGGDSAPFNRSSTPYTISQEYTISLAGTGTFSGVFGAAVTAVPAPAGLILAATALPFVGLIRRRLRKPEATTAA